MIFALSDYAIFCHDSGKYGTEEVRAAFVS